MNFEKIYRESSEGSTQVTSEEMLRFNIDNHRIVAKGTGPFGEDKGAEVMYFGPVDSREALRLINVDSEELEYNECESTREYCRMMQGADVVILDQNIGQSGSNFFLLDGGRDIKDLELYIED